jgi:heptosyltransferase-2
MAPVSRVVIRPPNWLGDAVLALPALGALRAQFPAAHVAVAAVPGVAALFRERTDLRPDEIIELAGKSRESAGALRSGRFDLGVLFPNSFHSAWLLRQAGVPARWGYATAARGWLLTRRSARARTSGVQHQSDYYRDLVRGLGVPCDDGPPRLSVSDRSAREAARLLERAGYASQQAEPAGEGRPLVGFAPGAAYGQAKQWPPDRVAAVAARLVRECHATCALMGAAHDRLAARAIESWLRVHAPEAVAHVINLIGHTSLGALAGVVSRCQVFVSNDSGAMHVAAAAGVGVTAVFGPTDDSATHPLGDAHATLTHPVWCRPCMLRECPLDHRCMRGVGVAAVLAAARRRL